MNQFRTSLQILKFFIISSSLFDINMYFVCFSWRFEKAAKKIKGHFKEIRWQT